MLHVRGGYHHLPTSLSQVDDAEATKIEVREKSGGEFIVYGKNFCKMYSFDMNLMTMEE